MKTEILQAAINNYQKIKFLYNLEHFEVEPDSIELHKGEKKYLYARNLANGEIQAFEFSKMINIKIIKNVSRKKLFGMLLILAK
ncbi:MAG: WYL domain-containing protein [Ignavibacteriales bacterium]|nr:WYL domain-containing protein [Ignavibacteriales bacterium]MCF8305234.1 WYL domain-containing protein [Ignavibacteriales bacterium]MCF8314853.1 WYL domain-containing protein [Ignavibacteriales bacterium]MCF8436198.1 WYL domain-containing protein [Ignavibacteriales bacterium]